MSDILDQLIGKQEAIEPKDLVPEEPKEVLAENTEQQKQEEQKQDVPGGDGPVKEEPKPRTFDANHPRFKRVWKELEELRTWKQEQEERAKQVQPEAVKQQDADMPQEFVSLFGDNPDAWKQMEKMLAARDSKTLEQAEARFKGVLESQQESAKREQEAQAKAVEVVEDAFLDLLDETGIDFTDRNNTERNQLLDLADRYKLFDKMAPKDAMDAAVSLYKEFIASRQQDEEREIVDEKRKIASKTNTKTNSSAKESNIFTPSKIKEIEKRGGIQFFTNS